MGVNVTRPMFILNMFFSLYPKGSKIFGRNLIKVIRVHTVREGIENFSIYIYELFNWVFIAREGVSWNLIL